MYIHKKYLEIPYNNNMVSKVMEFYDGGRLVYDIKVKIDCYTPEFYSYIDISDYMFKDLTIICKTSENTFEVKDKTTLENGDLKEDKFYIKQTDTIPQVSEYDNRYRPYIHFTAERGWLSDPNGLVYQDGIFHVFYQHNPASNEWGNMHWGHAISRDLLHWEHKNVALSPDEMGTIFTGCGILVKNRIMLFYTAAGNTSELSKNKDFTICMAYSDDKGVSFRKYTGNPLIFNISQKNRDPKIVYYKKLNIYIMALYLETSTYTLLSSQNLIEWKVLQNIELPGDSECPSLYPLYLDDDPEKIYWIFSGANDKYYVGNFEEEDNKIRYVPMQSVKSLHYGSFSYAPQVFFGTKMNEVLRLSWLNGNIPHSPFNGQFSIPLQMKLKTIANEIYLCANPIDEIKKYFRRPLIYTGIEVNMDNQFVQKLGHCAMDILLELDYDKNAIMTLQFFGVTVICDMAKNKVICKDSVSPITIKHKKVKMHMIIDKNSLEIFMDEGEFFMSNAILCDYHLDNIKIAASNKLIIKRIEISSIILEEIC